MKAIYSGSNSTKMASNKLHYAMDKYSDATAIRAWISGLEITLSAVEAICSSIIFTKYDI